MTAALSLRARFIIAAGVMVAVVVAFTLIANRAILSNTVQQNLDAKMDGQIDVLQSAIRPDGAVDANHVILLPHFQNAPLQWGWQIDAPGVRKAGGAAIDAGAVRWYHQARPALVMTGMGRSVAGVPMHMRRKDVELYGRRFRIMVFAPEQLLFEAMDAAIAPTQVALVFMSVTLLAVTYLQLFYSLQPLFRLRDAVAAVREGRLRRLAVGQPRELAPFAAELNALLDQNQAGLEHARHHVGNLAHGLKTPLATLTLRLAREGVSEETRDLVAQMARRIDHHLNRARAAARSTGDRSIAHLGEVARGLAGALVHLHEDKRLDLMLDASLEVQSGVDPADLDEMLGNLMDNACRHAVHRVRVGAQLCGSLIAVQVDDDGPGIAPEEMDMALSFGARLDETGQGYGLGLGIVRELAELYGGSLKLEPSAELGGLRAVLVLPYRI